MGFLDRFFKPKAKEVSFSEARRLFESLYASKKQELSNKASELSKQVKHSKQRIREALDALNSAKLLNEKIPAQEKSIMQGNRKAYTNQVLLLLHGLPDKPDIKEFEKRMGLFLKSTVRSFQVLMQFFETEVREVATRLKILEESVKSFQALHEDMAELDKTGLLFEEWDMLKQKKQAKLREKSLKQARIKELKSQIYVLENARKELVNSKENQQFKKNREDLLVLKQEVHEAELFIYQTLARFSKYLRKYHALIGDKLSLELIDAPGLAFMANQEATIKLFSAMQDLISRNQIAAKDKRKLLQRLAAIDWDKLRALTHSIRSRRARLLELQSQVDNTEIQKKLNELNDRYLALHEELNQEKKLLEELSKSPAFSRAELLIEIQEALRAIRQAD